MEPDDSPIYQNATYSISFVSGRPSKPQTDAEEDSTHSRRDAEAACQLRLPDCDS